MPSSLWLLLGSLGAFVLFLGYKRLDKAWVAKMYAKIIRSETNSIRNAEIAQQNQQEVAKADEIAKTVEKAHSGMTLEDKFEKLKRPITPK